MAQIDYDHDGIGHFISDHYVKVPIFQRPYSWDGEHVEAFFNDIANVYPEEYFVGTIVLTKKDGYFEIIDGQQRITTAIIFYAALRNFMVGINENEAATQYQVDYLFRKELKTKEVNPRITLGAEDNEFFRTNIVGNDVLTRIQPSKSSHFRIQKAYGVADKFIKSQYTKFGKSVEHLYDLADFLKTTVQIIIVTVDNDTNAFTVFETLNDRGLALSQTDLIKNYLFNRSGQNRLEESQQKWMSFKSAIEAAENEGEILEYVRHHLSSKEGLTREKELFKRIKGTVKTSTQVVTYLTELENDVQYYLQLLNPNHSNWNDYSQKCKDYIRTLLDLKLSRNRPLLLALVKKFTKTDLEKALKLIVAWSVRNLITGDTGAGTLEIEFSNQAKKISDNQIKTYNQLKVSINHLLPRDDTFKQAFEIATVSKSYIARYYLIELEKSYHSTGELETSKDTESVNLEHILPEKADLSTNWPEFSNDEHKSYCHRIGNLTIMDKKMNSSEKNNSYKEKKKSYGKSELLLTKNLLKPKSWNPFSINKRQKELAERAVKIWSIK